MSIDQPQPDILPGQETIVAQERTVVRLLAVRWIVIVAVLWFSTTLVGSGAVPAQELRRRMFGMPVAGWGFDLLSWELQALGEKVTALVGRPAGAVSAQEAISLVRLYLDRADQMRELEAKMNLLQSEGGPQTAEELERLQEEQQELRALQQELRPLVEQVIEGQVAWALVDEGFSLVGRPMPPVQFTFTEPPKKLVVSPRDRIETIYSRMLAPEISLAEIEKAEENIGAMHNASAYITNIGGLGAFPTMVIDRASLPWILSTVAHEWVHNYLVFFPLGWNYFASQDMTTLNETVAEIVGNEIGARVLSGYYPSGGTTAPEGEATQASEFDEPPPFDFRAEMRETRLEVDRLLADGEIEAAERYMEQRRQLFVANGYPLRVLNQAYFAFHGSYGTSAASVSPIGPKLERLRELSPDLETFLQTVRTFGSVADLDRALARFEAND